MRRAGGGQALGHLAAPRPGEQDRAAGNGGHLPAPHSLAPAPQGPQVHQPPRSALATVTLCCKRTHTTPFLCKNTQMETRARGEQRMDTAADVRGKCRPDPGDRGQQGPRDPRAQTGWYRDTGSHSCAPVPRTPTPLTHTPPHCLLALRSEGLYEAEGKSIRPGQRSTVAPQEGAGRKQLWLRPQPTGHCPPRARDAQAAQQVASFGAQLAGAGSGQGVGVKALMPLARRPPAQARRGLQHTCTDRATARGFPAGAQGPPTRETAHASRDTHRQAAGTSWRGGSSQACAH